MWLGGEGWWVMAFRLDDAPCDMRCSWVFFHRLVLHVNSAMNMMFLFTYNTLPKTNIDPENGTLKDCFPLQTSGFQVPC